MSRTGHTEDGVMTTFDAAEDAWVRRVCRVDAQSVGTHVSVETAAAHLSGVAAVDPPSQVWARHQAAEPPCAGTLACEPIVRVIEDGDGTWWCWGSGTAAVHESDLPRALARAERMCGGEALISVVPNGGNPRRFERTEAG